MSDTCPQYLILSDLIILIIFGEKHVLYMYLPIMHLPPVSCCFEALRSKYPPEELALKHPQFR
jgi:hypothetical protein